MEKAFGTEKREHVSWLSSSLKAISIRMPFLCAFFEIVNMRSQFFFFLHFLYEKNAKLCLESLHIMRQDRSLSSFSSLNLDVVGHSAVLHNPLLHNDWLAIKRETVPI